MTDSSKCDSSKLTEEEEMEAPNLRMIHKKTPSLGRRKSSALSSEDEETTSSSLIPIPNALRQIGSEFKSTVSNNGENYEMESSTYSVRAIPDDIPSSLEELRQKYRLKNEASVTMKMNTANLILDDILNNNNFNRQASESYPTKFIHNQKEKNHESETCSIESEATVRHCEHAPLPSFAHHLPHVPCDMPLYYCQRRDSSTQQICNCSAPQNKGMQVSSQNAKTRKASLLEKIQNLHLKYRIHSIYKIVQKNNPFSKDFRHEQGIPGSGNPDKSSLSNRFTAHKHENGQYSANQYPRRMIFDLVESSDVSQCDAQSVAKEDANCVCPIEMKCTCQSPKECTCSRLTAEFPENNCNASKYNRKESCPLKRESSPTQSSVKVNGFRETERSVRTVHKESKDIPSATLKENINAIGDEMRREIEDAKKYCFKEREFIERTDIYYFDHGNSSYYRTTDNHRVRYTECLVERTDEIATKFWGEIFGAIEVGFAFLISFILQFYRFFFTSIIRSVTVGLLQIFSDYFFKPLLTITFNGIIQPCLILAYNIATSLRDLSLPVSQIFGFFAKEVANLFKSCRLVEVNHNNCRLPSCHCENKV